MQEQEQAVNQPDSTLADGVDAAVDQIEAVVDDAAARLQEAESKLADLQNQLMYARAEAENIRRRGQEEVSNAHKYAVGKFAQELLAVKDSLEMALLDQSGDVQNLRMGVDMTLKQLVAAFDKVQLKEINPMGEKLDPHRHQAIGMIEHEAEPNTVVAVMQKGYVLAERVLRPAMVSVSKGKA